MRWMRFSAHLDADWSFLLLKLGVDALAGCVSTGRPGLDGGPPGNEMGRGLGHTPVATEQSGTPGWDQGRIR